MYTRSMENIYLSLRAQVAVGTFFMKSPVYLLYDLVLVDCDPDVHDWPVDLLHPPHEKGLV